MRTTEIDGKVYKIRSCEECPFRDMGGGWSAYCTHPGVGQGVDHIELTYGGIIPGRCPLREVKEHKPCPFCGSKNVEEAYADDTGEKLEPWMMDQANKESESEGLSEFASWDEFVNFSASYFHVQCGDCLAGVVSMVDMEDARNKWNRRAEE